MLGKNQGPDSDEHYDGGMEYAVLVSRQTLFPVCIFIDETFGDEYGVVVSLPEYEGGEYDVHYVEPDVA